MSFAGMKNKPDEAHIWTDAELEKLERRIAAEYKKAADEMRKVAETKKPLERDRWISIANYIDGYIDRRLRNEN